MMYAEILLGIFLSLTPPKGITEDPQVRKTRLATVALAIELEASDPVTAAMVAATIETESGHFDPRVHTGERKGDSGRAWCLGQIHAQSWLPKAYLPYTVGTGLTETRNCIRAVVRMYDTVLGCSTPIRDISAYATGRGCGARWKGAAYRESRMWYYLGKLRGQTNA